MRQLFFLVAAMLFMKLTSAQNVGIGITTPKSLLHLHQTSIPTLLFTNSTTGSLGSDGTALLQEGNNFVIDNGESADIIFKTNLAERMRILSGGNIGIGTATPSLARLHVEGMVGNTVAMFRGSPTSKGISFVADWPGIFFNSYFNGGVKAMSAVGYSSFINTEQTTGALTFNTTDVANTIANDPVTVPERMRIAGNGYVGIGTVSPNYHLQIHNSGSNSTSLQISNNAGGSTIYDGALITQENDDLNIENMEGAGKINLKNGGVPRMTITSTGLVGINQLNPIAPLDVSGPIRVNDGNQGVGKVLTSDALGNGSWKGAIACSAGHLSSGSIGGGYTDLIFDNEIYDLGGNYDNVTGIFTASEDGIYHFDGNINSATAISTGTFYLILKVNASINCGGGVNAATASETSVNYSIDLKLNAGDHVNWSTRNTTGTTILIYNDNADVRMSIHKVN